MTHLKEHLVRRRERAAKSWETRAASESACKSVRACARAHVSTHVLSCAHALPRAVACVLTHNFTRVLARTHVHAVRVRARVSDCAGRSPRLHDCDGDGNGAAAEDDEQRQRKPKQYERCCKVPVFTMAC
eukprot:4457711-Pleurochrysis_carterae.AAC.6